MSEPLVPAEVSMRGLPYMPLQIERLQKSKAWLVCKRRPELAFYILNLWMRAWTEAPAGSIEDDDDVLADAAMCPPDKFGQVKEDALRGWILCRDGRWYHPTVCEIALETWEKRTGAEKKRAEDRERKRKEREASRHSQAVQDVSAGQTQDKDDCPAENALKGREEKVREGKKVEARATRLPTDWQPTDEDWKFAQGEGMTVPEIETEAAKFRDYWTAKGGKDGRKLDWNATWRNWIRNRRAAPQRAAAGPSRITAELDALAQSGR